MIFRVRVGVGAVYPSEGRSIGRMLRQNGRRRFHGGAALAKLGGRAAVTITALVFRVSLAFNNEGQMTRHDAVDADLHHLGEGRDESVHEQRDEDQGAHGESG